ncbi:MAG: hypothetical protein KKF50_03585 [Nanoarchaeota archaeon]|nr:hypothetical protein [Nanoarchaeota archaeon]
MRFGKKGGLWMWFWIFVAIIVGAIGLYFLILNVTDINTITSIGQTP